MEEIKLIDGVWYKFTWRGESDTAYYSTYLNQFVNRRSCYDLDDVENISELVRAK